MTNEVVAVGEGFAFFRWHSLKWGPIEAVCQYSCDIDICAQIWDRIRFEAQTALLETPK